MNASNNLKGSKSSIDLNNNMNNNNNNQRPSIIFNKCDNNNSSRKMIYSNQIMKSNNNEENEGKVIKTGIVAVGSEEDESCVNDLDTEFFHNSVV